MASTACARSPELSSLVISYLAQSEPLAAYATVCGEWRRAVEQRTFSTLRLTPAQLADFSRIVTGPRRYTVRHFEFDIVLDPYSKEARGKFEDQEDQETNNKIFTEAFQSLFHILSTWREDEVFEEGVRLSVTAYSPSDWSHMDPKELEVRKKTAPAGIGPRDLKNRRFERSYLRLSTSSANLSRKEILPTVSIITNLNINRRCPVLRPTLRAFWLPSISAIASRLPRLRVIEISLPDGDKRGLGSRKKSREGKSIFINSYIGDLGSLSLMKKIGLNYLQTSHMVSLLCHLQLQNLN